MVVFLYFTMPCSFFEKKMNYCDTLVVDVDIIVKNILFDDVFDIISAYKV